VTEYYDHSENCGFEREREGGKLTEQKRERKREKE